VSPIALSGSRRFEAWLWLLQRLSAAALAIAVAVHLATLIYAVRTGLTAAAILARLSGSTVWLAFYSLFTIAVAVHAPIGLRAVLGEHLAWRGRPLDLAMLALALALAFLGLRAAIGLTR
jgi:fumarate reductase subunit C